MKRLRALSGDERGIGMIPFLITAAVVGIILAGMSSSVVTMLRSQVSVAASAEATLLVDQLQATLSHEVACSSTLTNLTPDPKPGGSIPGWEPLTPVAGVKVRLGDQDVTLSEGLQILPGYRLLKFRVGMEDAALIGPNLIPTITDGGEAVTNRRIKVFLQLEKTAEGIFTPVSIPREFMIDANVRDSNGTIKSCAARSMASQACYQIGGVWNTSVSDPVDGNRCISNTFCQYGGSFSGPGMPPVGAFVNPYTGAATCPAGFTPQQSGSVSLANASGKTNVFSTAAATFSCMRCAQDPKATAVQGDLVMDGGAIQAAIDASLAEANARDSQNQANRVCLAAQRVAGRADCPATSNPCGSSSPSQGMTCDPRKLPWATAGATCSLPDGGDDGFGNPTYSNFTDTFSCTCPRVVPKPAGC